MHVLIKLASTDKEMCTDFGAFACLESCIVEASDCVFDVLNALWAVSTKDLHGLQLDGALEL